MRIISGKYRGKNLKSFEGFDVRPTSDRAREALFSILYNKVIGSNFLDLCSGTGAIGLEAISRGAKKVTFVDNSRDSLKILEFNLKSIKETADIRYKDALLFLRETKDKFDIIFFDPPYAFNDIKSVLSEVFRRSLLNENGLFIYEHKADKPSLEIENFTLVNSKKYGIAVFDFYRIKSNIEE